MADLPVLGSGAWYGQQMLLRCVCVCQVEMFWVHEERRDLSSRRAGLKGDQAPGGDALGSGGKEGHLPVPVPPAEQGSKVIRHQVEMLWGS